MAKNYVSNKDETVRMFENDFMESLSKVHYTVPLYIYVPVILYFSYLSVYEYKLSLINIILLFALGLLTWTLTEYTLHRFIFHFEPKSDTGKKLHFMFHGVHHDYPNDSKRLVMPPSVSVPLALLLFYIFNAILGDIFIAPFFVGFILGYLVYDLTHYAIHHFNMKNRVLLAIKNHHMLHHYQNSERGFGVSTPFWDRIIGTDFPKKKKEK